MISLLDAGNAVDIVYLDFSKVPHDILVRKLGCIRSQSNGLVIGWLIEPKGCSLVVRLHLGGR